MIHIRLVRAGCPPTLDRLPARWILLGRDPSVEAACEHAFGRGGRLDIASRLQGLAERLRADYSREIARIGVLQPDLIGWCSSSFAWKHPDVSGLFLLSCYRLLIQEFAAAPSSEGDLIIALEDPWLFEDCRQDLQLGDRALFEGEARLGFEMARSLFRGLASRLVWAGKTARGWILQRRSSLGRSRRDERAACYIYSLPNRRCFTAPGEWKDPFFPGLDAVLERGGVRVRRLVPPGTWGFEREVAEREEIARPMILEASPADFFAAAVSIWSASGLDSYVLSGVSMPLLARREWWTDLGYARWCEYRFFYDCFRRFLARSRPAAVVYPYENQPWEKLIVLASRGSGTTTIGYQHSVAPRFFLGYWPGPEERGTPLPDRILASGPRQRQILIEAGHPAGKTAVGGSLRFRYLAGLTVHPRSRSAGGAARVLVVGVHNPAMTQGAVAAVRSAFPDGGSSEGLEISFRPHPTAPPGAFRSVKGWVTVDGDLAARLDEFDLVVTTGSTVAFEARLRGLPVIIFRPSADLDADDLGNMAPEGFLAYASSAEMRTEVLRQLREPRDGTLEVAGLRDALFSTVDERAWLDALGVASR